MLSKNTWPKSLLSCYIDLCMMMWGFHQYLGYTAQGYNKETRKQARKEESKRRISDILLPYFQK